MKTQEHPIPSNGYFIWRLVRYQPVLYVVNAVVWILYHSLPLLVGLLGKLFFDLLAGSGTATLSLQVILALMFAVAVARVGIIYAGAASGVPLAFRVRGLLQRNLLAHILQRPAAKAIPGSIGEAISTLRDDAEAIYGIITWAFDAIAAFVFAVMGTTILLLVNARVTALVFVPIVAVIILAQRVGMRLKGLRDQSRNATAAVTGMIGETFGAVQAIQVSNSQKQVVAHVRRLGAERERKILRDQLFSAILDAVYASTATLGTGLTLLVAARAMRSGDFTVGDFALFATYLLQLRDFTRFLGYLMTTYQQSDVSFRRLLDLLRGAPPEQLVAHHALDLGSVSPTPDRSVKTAADNLELLEVKGLTFRHAESGKGVEDISFTLKRGTITVITGRMGSGKTTLVRTVLGLLEQQAGTVSWNGTKVERPGDFFVPPRAGYVPQVPTLLSGTLRENLLLGLCYDPPAVDRAVRTAVLEQDLAGFAEGLCTAIGAKGVRLSGGQIQRTAAARALIREPELLVFDDISSALDLETETRLWERVFERYATFLVVSHRPAALLKADQILVLENGRMSGCGTLKELLETNEEMRRLWSD